MGETEEANKFETGVRSFVNKWKGLVIILMTIVTAAWGGYRHMEDIEDSIVLLGINLQSADKRITALEATSARDREAIVRIEVSVMHMNDVLRRIENKIDQKNP